jgi:radical SAM superfamily enzyme YgiQ (UPF0313 family)
LGAGLKLDEHVAEIVDARLTPDFESACRRFQPQVVGITGYTSQLNIVKKLAVRLKTVFPATWIVIGGHHATVRPEDFNLKKSVDRSILLLICCSYRKSAR